MFIQCSSKIPFLFSPSLLKSFPSQPAFSVLHSLCIISTKIFEAATAVSLARLFRSLLRSFLLQRGGVEPPGVLGAKNHGLGKPGKNNWKHLLSAMAMLVCWRCNPIHPMQTAASQSLRISSSPQSSLKQWLSTHHHSHCPIPFWVPSTSLHRSSRCFPATASCPGVDSSAHRCCKCFRATWVA